MKEEIYEIYLVFIDYCNGVVCLFFILPQKGMIKNHEAHKYPWLARRILRNSVNSNKFMPLISEKWMHTRL